MKLDIPSQRRENNGRIRFLSPEEEKMLREKIVNKYGGHLPEFEIALHTGMRKSEQYRLAWDCIDFKNRTVTVPQSKNGEVRYIRLNTTALAVLRALHAKCDGIGPVFANERGTALTTPRQWFEEAVKIAKLRDFTWHCIRHTFASRLIMRGASLRDVQDAMGHKTISMTCRYAHLAPMHQLAVVERLCENEEAEPGVPSDAGAPVSSGAEAIQEPPTDTRTDTVAHEYAEAELELVR